MDVHRHPSLVNDLRHYMVILNSFIFILLGCFQGAIGMLHNSFSLFTTYAAFPLEEPFVKLSITFFNGIFCYKFRKIKEYSHANCSNDQLGKEYKSDFHIEQVKLPRNHFFEIINQSVSLFK